MIKYTFNNGKEYPLIQDSKLIAKLNKRYRKISRINNNFFYPGWDKESVYYIVDLNLFHGARSEIYDYWFSDKVDQYWETVKDLPITANMVLDMSVTPISSVVHKGEFYFFCLRHDEGAEPFRLWFKLDDGVVVNG